VASYLASINVNVLSNESLSAGKEIFCRIRIYLFGGLRGVGQFLIMLYRFLFALFLQSVASQYYYKEISPFRPLNISTSCILTNPPGDIACTLYQIQGIQIEATCLEKNVVRIVGEFDTVRIICSCPHALDFRYHGIQVGTQFRTKSKRSQLLSSCIIF